MSFGSASLAQNAKPINAPLTRTAIEQCLTIGARLASATAPVCDVLTGSKVIGKSTQADAIYAFETGASAEKARVRVLVIGAIHGDETSAAWLPYQWISQVLPKAALVKKALLIRVVPMANPDNALALIAKRTNARGVDLNRNFPTQNWVKESAKWWAETTKKDPRRWPGNAPASEAESKLIIAEIDRFKPTVIVSVHAPFGVLDFDGLGVIPPARIGSLRLDTVGIYPGSLGNYAGMTRGIPVVTLELPAAQRATSIKEAQSMWNDLSAWLEQRDTLVALKKVK